MCGSNEISKIGDIDYRTPVMFSTYLIHLDKVPELFECIKCWSWFSQNIISHKTAIKYYSEGQSCNKWPRSVTFVEEKSAELINQLNRYLSKDKKVLDIGCNTGILLDHARNKGCITVGVEPSSASREILMAKGHTAYSSLEEVEGKYDVITAFDLVEHLYDLPGFFVTVNNLLVDSGIFILLTGDISSRSARISREKWWYLKAPEHIIFPSKHFLAGINFFELVSIVETYASKAYDRSIIVGIVQYFRKAFFLEGYDGLPSLGPDHLLATFRKTMKS